MVGRRPIVPSTGCAYDESLLVTTWPQGSAIEEGHAFR